ncbi:cellulose biosynthesis protein CelD, partial [Rhizobium sp. BR5]
GRADILALQNIPLIWRGRINPLSHLASVENQNPAFQLPLLDSFENTLRQVNGKRRRKKFRIQSRR